MIEDSLFVFGIQGIDDCSSTVDFIHYREISRIPHRVKCQLSGTIDTRAFSTTATGITTP